MSSTSTAPDIIPQEVMFDLLARNPYIPHLPTERQLTFLELNCLDALFGGAAGGGKSDGLLMAALMFAQVPGYAALIVRRNFTDLKLPGGLLDRSIDWLRNVPGAKYNAQAHRWKFKEGSTLQFGFADKEGDEKRYHGAEFQYAGIDEAVQFTETQIKFFFERIRRKRDIPVPLRVRLGTTPGGVSHEFLKKRYIDPGTPGKVFVPAKLPDNPHLDQEQYVESLAEVDSLRRKQMLDGDWDAVEGGRFKREWFGSWKVEKLLPDTMTLRDYRGAEIERFQWARCARFQTCDPCASTRTTGDYFVLSTWLVTPKGNVVWWGCRRDHPDIEEQVAICRDLYRRYEAQFLAVEKVLNQTGLWQMLSKRQMVVRAVSPMGQDKLARAAGAITLASSGRVFLPEPPCPDFPLDEVLDELIRFVGDDKKDAHDDVVDTFSYACQLLPMVRPGHNGNGGRPPLKYMPKGEQAWGGLR
jgi:phage terminase large subunit-like protein